MSSRLTGDFHKALNKTYLGHWDCPEGGDLIVTIDHFEKSDVRNNSGSTEKKNVCYFRDGVKPMICNVTNMKMIASVLGTPKFEEWEGQQIALYAADVKQAEDGKGLRVRPTKPKVTEAFCEECGQKISKHGSYSVNKIVELSMSKYKKKLCWDCAMKEAEAGNE